MTRVAVAVWNGCVAPVLDVSRHVLVAEVTRCGHDTRGERYPQDETPLERVARDTEPSGRTQKEKESGDAER